MKGSLPIQVMVGACGKFIQRQTLILGQPLQYRVTRRLLAGGDYLRAVAGG